MQRRTKIVCTLGPASDSPEKLRALIAAGMNVARMNFSHGTHDEHRARYDRIRAAAAETGANVAILMDLQGPKIRTGKLAAGQVMLERGAPFTITAEPCPGDVNRVSTTYPRLPHDVHPGDRILIADGLLELRVLETAPPEVHCEVVRGGALGSSKGINLPGVAIAEPSLTEKDKEDLAFGLGLGVDYVALSFVRRAADLRDIRALVDAAASPARIVAKIERPEALQDFDGILRLADAIMVARGDLGVEVPFEEVPILQKDMIRRCNAAGVPVITATQMLESMTDHVRATRAEVTDVANAIFDGTDAVMLSGETAAGQFPIEACATMAAIAARADEALLDAPAGDAHSHDAMSEGDSFAGAIGQAAAQMAHSLDVRAVVCFTSSGYTARQIARFRPNAPIIAASSSEKTLRQCALLRGVSAFLTEETKRIEDIPRQVDALLLEKGLAQRGDVVVIVAGTPLALAGRTNFLKLHRVGDTHATR